MEAVGIIPARFGSSRFPGKPLAMIGNKTMIQWVYERALKADFKLVAVATDDIRIHQTVQKFNGISIMTSNKHRTGTERIAQAITEIKENFDLVVNIQGDEPFIEAEQLNHLIQIFYNQDVEISTLIQQCNDNEELFSPNTIKVIKDFQNYAMYFSRAVIPYCRDEKKKNWTNNHKFFKHIGIYAYRKNILQEIVKIQPQKLEVAESLEQLRWMAKGYKIKLIESEYKGISVDTPEDLETVIEIYNKGLVK